MKLLTPTLLILAMNLTACGGSTTDTTNPFEAVAQTIVVEDTQETVEPTVTEPVVTQPVAEPITQPVLGACLDYAPLNDGIGWNGVSECALPITETEDVEVPVASPPVEPVTEPVITIPIGFDVEGGSVLGQWVCASSDDEGNVSDWNNTWNLNFNDDQTVTLQDGSNALSTWWYTADGVSVQWSHSGLTVDYVLNLNNYGGMSDSGSHCLRDLPTVSDPIEELTALELMEAALQPWLNQHLRCQNLIRGGGNFQRLLLEEGSTYSASVLEPIDESTIQYSQGSDYVLNDSGFTLGGEQWFITEDSLTTTWTQETGQRNCFLRD